MQCINFQRKIQLSAGADCDCARSCTGTCHAGGIRFCGEPDEDSVCVNETTLWYSLVGNGFIDFIRMLVIPLVMVSIIHVILHMDERENVHKLVKRGILTMGMVAVAAVVGLTLGIVFQLGGSGSAASITNGEMKEVVRL